MRKVRKEKKLFLPYHLKMIGKGGKMEGGQTPPFLGGKERILYAMEKIKKQRRGFERDLTQDPLLPTMIRYALPLIGANVLQVLFNAADVSVLGIFLGERGDLAVAAVGATGSLINLIVNLFIGLSIGANVMVSRAVGEKNAERAHRLVGTSLLISVLFGVLLSAVGYFGAETFLGWMGCPENVLPLSAKYMRIYFLGMPLVMLYNFASSILRAVGDTTRPLLFLLFGGVVNVGLNIFFVTVAGMEVEGVAIATVVSQGICAILCVIAMLRSEGYAQLSVRYLRIHREELLSIFRVGFPAGVQGCLFSISNVMIQSAINSFGDVFMTGSTVSNQFEGIIYQAINSVAIAGMAFVSQNLGAGRIDRVRRCAWCATGVDTVLGITLSAIVMMLHDPLFHIMTDSEEVVTYATVRMSIIGLSYFLCGLMDVWGNAVRGMGQSTLAMIVSLIGNCGFRILWINTVFRLFHNQYVLYVQYSISWVLAMAAHMIVFHWLVRGVEKNMKKVEKVSDAVAV